MIFMGLSWKSKIGPFLFFNAWYSAIMNFMTFDWLVVISVIGLLLYWRFQEQNQSRADRSKSQHRPTIQRLVRWSPEIVGLMLIAQLVGFIKIELPLSEATKQTFFILGLLLFWFAAALAIWARRTLGLNWAHAADFQVIPGQELVTEGPYRFIRHPIYVAFFMMFIAIELIVASWLILFGLPLLLFLTWQAKKEEALLSQSFGPAYQDYMQRSGRLFPRLK